jgi:hypothetical protein
MSELDVTWSRALKIWWAIFWRCTLISLASSLVLLVVVAVFALGLGISGEAVGAFDRSRILQFIFFGIGAVISLVVTKVVLNLRWAGFRIALISTRD